MQSVVAAALCLALLPVQDPTPPLTVRPAVEPTIRPELELWPDGPPGEPDGMEALRTPDQTGPDGAVVRIRFVDTPTLTVHRPPGDNANGCCVVIAPGGGYHLLAWDHEGVAIAEWLNSLGVTAVLLKYRVPRRDPDAPHRWPLQDAQRAIRLTRHHAERWGIDPGRVGMLGFSAGGHLTLATGTHDGAPTYERVDAADQRSARPDFLVPIYAAYLADRDDPEALAPEIRIGPETPPTFMAVTLDDKTRGVDAARVLIELKRHGVEAELHVFARGGHGYGLQDRGHSVREWPGLCAAWMRELGFLDAKARADEGRR